MADGNAIGTLDAFAVHGRERPIASRFKSRSFYARTPRAGSGQFQPKKRIYRVTHVHPHTTHIRYVQAPARVMPTPVSITAGEISLATITAVADVVNRAYREEILLV